MHKGRQMGRACFWDMREQPCLVRPRACLFVSSLLPMNMTPTRPCWEPQSELRTMLHWPERVLEGL